MKSFWKILFSIAITIILEKSSLFAQLNVTPTGNATTLANQLAGQGLIINSSSLTCPSNAAGIFSNGNSTSLGITSGIVLTTGLASDVSGSANNGLFDTHLRSVDNNGGQVPQLEAIIPNAATTEDGCYLDITVTPICNTLSMRYVFGSEEYPDFVNSPYNDVFGFFVSGPNPNGGNYTNQNIAIVPNTTNTAVAINSVNNGTNNTGPCTNCAYYVNNSNSNTIAYDGLTTPLTASIAVVPCATYTIRLAIADVGDGLYDSGVFIEANSVSCQVNLVASAAPYTICSGQTTTLTANVPNGTGTYSWSTGQSGNTITVSPTSTTIYTSYYTFCGSTVTDTVKVVVNQAGGATFQYLQNSYCKGTSNPIPTNVANGTTFSASPSGLVFVNTATGEINLGASAAGTYTISLPGSGACPTAATQVITIQDAPTATLSGSGNICAGQTVPLSVSFTGTAPFTFSFDSAGTTRTITTNQNPYIINAGAIGNYSLLSVSDAACSGTVSGTATLGANPLPTANFSGGGNYCQGSSANPIIISLTGSSPFVLNYTENNTPTTQTINGNNYTYTPNGSVSLNFTQITDNTGCTNTLNQQYTIQEFPLPSGSISGGGAVCFGNSPPPVVLTLTGNSPWTVNYSINGGNNQSVTVNSSPFNLSDQTEGNYTITQITDVNGCTANGTGSAQITYFPGVTATVSASQVKICEGQTATVNASGGVSASWNPAPTISSSSDYTLSTSPPSTTIYTVTVNDGNGCTDTALVNIIVNPLPDADFSNNQVCVGNPTIFTNLSSIANGTITNYSWYFEAGANSTQSSPQHIFSSCGTFSVSLLTISNENCRDSITKSLTVYCNPQALFTIDDTLACEMQTINFTNNSIAPFGSTSQWNFGDGQGTSQAINATYAYNNSGNYQVNLIITTPNGCTNSITKSLIVQPSPVADFQASTACLNTATVFTNNSVSNGGPITSYLWTFDINNPSGTSTLQDPQYTYQAAQNYTAQLIVSSANNCTDTITKTVTVTPIPLANFTVTDACLGSANTFTSISTIADNSTLTYTWDFQSDNTADAYIPITNYIFPSTGTYNTTLYAVSNNGCKDSITKTVSVYSFPQVDFIADKLADCEPLTVTLTNASTVSNPSNIVSYSWYVSGNLISNSTNLSHTFNAGTYSIKLVATTNYGCTDSTERINYITAYPNPKAEFDYLPKDATILNPIISFTDQSIGTITTWSWVFDEKNNGNLLNDNPQFPEYMYADTGKYNVTLWVTSDKGCTDSTTKIISISPEFIIYIPNAFTPNADMINQTFFPKGVGINEKEGYTLNIFDRWGNLIFSTNDFATGWNGKFNNTEKDCMADTYVYKIVVKDFKGRKHQFYGQVNLIR